MKKLLTLTEITFKTGEEIYKSDYLALTEVPYDAVQNDVTEAACRVVTDNFKVWYPESSLISVCPKPTIANVLGEVSDNKEKPAVIIAHAAFPATTPPPQNGKDGGMSDDVMLDLDGNREWFTIAYYDHDSKEWNLQDKEELFDINNAQWMHLPLAKYDKK
jgi:hypothetical protein